jgi:hypothetical protein
MAASFGFFHAHFQLPLVRRDHHLLRSHPPHHIERLLWLAMQGQFLHILRDPFFDLIPHRLLDPVKPVRRT